MNYKIRAAHIGDLYEIVKLCAEHAQYEQANYSPEGKKEKLAEMLFCEHPQLFCLIVEQNNTTIGYASYSKECSTWNAAYYIHMDCLFIREPFRGLGIGHVLINEITTQAKLQKASHLEWQTPVFNERAIKFYKRIGATSKEKQRFTLTL